jgi:signal transduction histidine kinase
MTLPTMTKLIAAGLAGLTAVWGLAVAFGDTLAAAAEVVALAAGPAIIFSVAGAAVLRRLGRCTLFTYLSVGVLTTSLAFTSGILLASWQMLLSAKDAKTVVVVVLAAGTIGVLTAVSVAAGLRKAVAGVARIAASLGSRPLRDGALRDEAPRPVPTAELSALVAQLHEIGEQLHESIVRERTLERSRRELVAWISHDLRTPLAGIQAIAEALEDGVVSEPATIARYYKTMRSEVARLSGMVDDLFRLSRIHSGLVNLQVEVVSMRDLVSDALAVARPVAEAKGVRLQGEVDSCETYLRLSTTEFLRMLRNLLDNALRHTPPGGAVSVRASATSAEALVSVHDGCGGIPDGDLDRVFDVGYRGDEARSPGNGARAGLGLAIARGLAGAHGGDIHVANGEDGCIFTVRLPLPMAS